MVAPDLIPVWVGFGLLLLFAALSFVAAVYCAVCIVVGLVNGEHR